MADTRYGSFVEQSAAESEDKSKKKKQLADTLGTPAEDPNNPIKTESVKYYMDSLYSLANDPQYQQEASPASRQSLAEAMDRAEQLYKEKANINDWAEVGSMLARAVSQYGAARAGLRSGVDMSGLKFDPGIDWSKRTERAARERDTTVSGLEKLSATERQEWVDRRAGQQEELRRKTNWAEAGLSAAQNEAARALQDKRLAQQLAKEEGREKDDKRINRVLSTLKDQENRLSRQEQALQDEVDATQELADRLSADGVSKKTLAAWEKENPKLARQSGLSLKNLKRELDAQETWLPKYAGGRSSKEEEAAKNAIIQQKLQAKLDALSGARKKREELTSKREQLASGAISPDEVFTPEAAKAPAPSRDKTVEDYAKRYNLSYEKALEILGKRGYTPEK